MGASTIALVGGLLTAATIVGLIMFIVSRYRRCPADQLLVISGKGARVVSGGGVFVWPIIQEYDYLDLAPFQVKIDLKDALSFENIRIAVPSVFTVAIGTTEEVRNNAATRLLQLNHEDVVRTASDIIFGQLRQVIAAMTIDEINRDRDGFLQKIQHAVEPEIRKVGLVLINVNITDLKDDSGYIEAIGKKAASQAINQARADVAEQDKLGAIRVAEAERTKAVSVAGLQKEQQIGEQTAQNEQAARIAEVEQARRIAVAAADASAKKGEAENQATIVAAEAELTIRQAEAYQLSETRKREAKAAVEQKENEARTLAAHAYAQRMEAEKRAEIEAPAKAEAARLIVEAEAKAQQRQIAAEAEAKATYLALDARARGEAEIIRQKADALGQLVTKIGSAQDAISLLMLEQLPMLADTSAKAISGIKFDKVMVWDTKDGDAVGNFTRGVAKSMPPMLELLEQLTGMRIPKALQSIDAEAVTIVNNANGTEQHADAPV